MEENINTDIQTTKNSNLVIGAIILVVGFLSPLLIPFVLASDWSATQKNVISGLLAFGIPEVFMLLAVAVMGKKGYEFVKKKAAKYLKRFAPPDSVSLTRYRIGLFMFCLPILIGIVQPYLGSFGVVVHDIPIWVTITLDIIFISSLFVLGGDFWDKLRGLFKYDVKALKQL